MVFDHGGQVVANAYEQHEQIYPTPGPGGSSTTPSRSGRTPNRSSLTGSPMRAGGEPARRDRDHEPARDDDRLGTARRGDRSTTHSCGRTAERRTASRNCRRRTKSRTFVRRPASKPTRTSPRPRPSGSSITPSRSRCRAPGAATSATEPARARASCHGDDRLVAHLQPDRQPHHRCHQRLPDDAVQHPGSGVGRRAPRGVRRTEGWCPEVRPSSDEDYYGHTDADGFLGEEVPVAGRSATSRPPCSGRPASTKATRRTPTAPAPST